jgi:hypothetical protein
MPNQPRHCRAVRDPYEHEGPWILLTLVLLGAAVAGIWQMPDRIHSDCALCLEEAELLVGGAVPCCDFVDTNPPLVAYLNVPPVLLARALGISPILAFHCCVLLLLAVSTAEIRWLLRNPRAGLRPMESGLVLLAWVGFYLLVDWHGNVGQREHLFVLLYVPYLMLRVLRHRGGSAPGWPAVLLGIQAGLGASLKPHFLVLAAVVECLLIFCPSKTATRPPRSSLSPLPSPLSPFLSPENLALAGVVAAYLLHWLLAPAAMREAFFGRWVPMICRGYHAADSGYRDLADGIVADPVAAAGLVAIVGAVALGTRPRTHLREQFLALGALGVMGLAIAFYQKKGWPYQRLPFEVAGVLGLALWGSRWLGGRPGGADVPGCQEKKGQSGRRECPPRQDECPPRQENGARRFGFFGPAILVGVLLSVWFVGRKTSANVEPANYAALRQIVEARTRPGDRVMVLATSPSPGEPMLLKTGRRPGSRYLNCMPLVMLYADWKPAGDRSLYRSRDEAPAEELRFLADLQDDVRTRQPRLVIVNNRDTWYGLPDHFNIFDYLVHAGWTRQALASYRPIPGPEGWKVFERATPVTSPRPPGGG